MYRGGGWERGSGSTKEEHLTILGVGTGLGERGENRGGSKNI